MVFISFHLKFVKNQSETFENDQKLTIILQIFSAAAAKLWRRSGSARSQEERQRLAREDLEWLVELCF